MKKRVLENLAKFKRKHLCQSLFFNKLWGVACNFIKKETLAQLFSFELCEIFEDTFFLLNTSGDCFCRMIINAYYKEHMDSLVTLSSDLEPHDWIGLDWNTLFNNKI